MALCHADAEACATCGEAFTRAEAKFGRQICTIDELVKAHEERMFLKRRVYPKCVKIMDAGGNVVYTHGDVNGESFIITPAELVNHMVESADPLRLNLLKTGYISFYTASGTVPIEWQSIIYADSLDADSPDEGTATLQIIYRVDPGDADVAPRKLRERVVGRSELICHTCNTFISHMIDLVTAAQNERDQCVWIGYD